MNDVIRWFLVAVSMTSCGSFIQLADKSQVQYNACYTRGALLAGMVPGTAAAMTSSEISQRLSSLDAFLARNSLNCQSFQP